MQATFWHGNSRAQPQTTEPATPPALPPPRAKVSPCGPSSPHPRRPAHMPSRREDSHPAAPDATTKQDTSFATRHRTSARARIGLHTPPPPPAGPSRTCMAAHAGNAFANAYGGACGKCKCVWRRMREMQMRMAPRVRGAAERARGGDDVVRNDALTMRDGTATRSARVRHRRPGFVLTRRRRSGLAFPRRRRRRRGAALSCPGRRGHPRRRLPCRLRHELLHKLCANTK